LPINDATIKPQLTCTIVFTEAHKVSAAITHRIRDRKSSSSMLTCGIFLPVYLYKMCPCSPCKLLSENKNFFRKFNVFGFFSLSLFLGNLQLQRWLWKQERKFLLVGWCLWPLPQHYMWWWRKLYDHGSQWRCRSQLLG